MSIEKHFNLRVYGIIKNSEGEILISDECRNHYSFTKFPGGGLEAGEGIADCLKRELKEELDIDATIGDLFYVNDFHQESAFRKTDQLISFYFEVSEYSGVITTLQHTVPVTEEVEKFRWVRIEDLSEEMMTFPIDKIVVQKLK
ncbi:MAG: NUDIX hydrolase [Crocinitomicaceae bacterium]|nr:NUDIX hydrolase [Crocinitomicaceae bacterium]